jgi:hypothetical protein
MELIQFFSSKTWSIQRRILDRRFDLYWSFCGKANFESQGSVWIYEEQGELVSRAQSYSTKRRYIYELQDDSLNVRFDDGRHFYSIDCRLLPYANFQHICGSDRYLGRLSIGSNGWNNEWQVIGPNKDLEILSGYT